MSTTTFVSGLKVVYGDSSSDAPADCLKDYFGGSNDINHDFDGKYVWLVPELTTQVCSALTGFYLAIQTESDTHYADLAKDAGGDFRYLIPVKQSNQVLFVSELILARSSDALSDEFPSTVWHGMQGGISGDINKGRGGDYLYLVWKLQSDDEV